MDRIVLQGVVFRGCHGALEEERRVLQPFTVDFEFELDLSRAGHTDDLADTFDYRQAHAIAKQVIEGPSVNLLETLADRIADRLLAEAPSIAAVNVTVGKHPPLDGEVKLAAVHIRRTRRAP